MDKIIISNAIVRQTLIKSIDYKKALVINVGHGKGSGIPGPIAKGEDKEGGKVAASALFDVIDMLDMKEHDDLLSHVKKLNITPIHSKKIEDSLEELHTHISNRDKQKAGHKLDSIVSTIEYYCYSNKKLFRRISQFLDDGNKQLQSL